MEGLSWVKRRVQHSCDVWTRQGINCPGGLINAREGVGDPTQEIDPMVQTGDRQPRIIPPIHRKAEKANAALANFQLAVLLELGRQALVEEALSRVPPQVRIPAEMVKEAYRQGARGKTLALWVAAASATLAIGLKFGPGASRAIPGVIRPTGGGGIGFHFQAPTFKGLVRKRVKDFLGVARTGSGEFFQGTEG